MTVKNKKLNIFSGAVLIFSFLVFPISGNAQFFTVENITMTATGGGTNASISNDARYVVFESESADFVAGDTNGLTDIFLYDRNLDTYERVSVDSLGVESNDESFEAIISGDGEFVVYESNATNLVAGDTNASKDIFVYTIDTGATERVSVDENGVEGDGNSSNPFPSLNGRYIVFRSSATNLVAGDVNGNGDIFVYDRNLDTVESITFGADDDSGIPVISADGRYVTFTSDATNLVAGDTNLEMDAFVYDRNTDTMERVSVDADGIEGDTGASRDSTSISSDGRYVAFISASTNLVSGDTNGNGDVFVYDRNLDTIERVSVATDGTEADGVSENAIISPNGRFVFFVSGSSNLISGGELNDFKNIFVRDLSIDLTTRVSIGENGEQGNGESLQQTPQAFGLDGKTLVFQTNATNFTDNDVNGFTDIMVAVLSDNDGVTPTVEDAAPNSGDVDESGVPDSIEHNISSALNSVTGEYTTLVSTGECFDNEDVTLISESSLSAQDPSYDYPAGIIDFDVNCRTGLGDDTTVTAYFFGVEENDLTLRKINHTTGVSQAISSYTATPVTIDGESALKIEYSITDGGILDEDGTVNGIIIDPVGLAQVDSTPAQSGGSSTGSRPKKIAMNQTENSTVCTIFTTSMKQGSKYGEVSKLQEKLNTLGFNSGIADGLFGPKTNLAVKAFQTVKKLASDGIVGPMTRGVLNDCK